MMLKYFIVFYILTFLSTVSLGAGLSEPKECFMENGTKGQCYQYTLSPKVTLDVMVVERKYDQGPRGAPVFLLAGGPGQGAISSFGGYVEGLDEVNRTRDLVLVDQLGTGSSSPLTCKKWDKVQAMDELLAPDKVLGTLISCGQGIGESNHSFIDRVGTDAYIEQLRKIAESLSYEKVSLFGVSYGTRVAVRFGHLYPEFVESMVLEGVAGNELRLFNNMPEGTGVALKVVDERLEKSGLPKVRSVSRLLEKLKTQLPQTTRLRDPGTGKFHEVKINSLLVDKAMRIFLYDPYLSSILNIALENAIDGDFQGLFTPMLSSDFAINPLHMLTVACSEDYDQMLLSKDLPPQEREQIIKLCDQWPKFKIAEDFHTQKKLNIPTLLMNGTGDPATPISNAKRLAKLMTPSQLISFDKFGHNVFYLPCARKIVQEFYEKPEKVEGIGSDCLKKVHVPKVFYSNVGPK